MSKQEATVKQHFICEIKLAAKIAICFLSVVATLLLWAFAGIYFWIALSAIAIIILAPNQQLRYAIIKRVLDVLFAFLVLILFPFIFLIINIAIKLTSQGPVFFKSKRIGRNNRPFHIYKFRTMYINFDPPKAMLKGISSGPGVTKLGRFLRRISLDELPQLFNILKGDMSLVGPRAPDVSEFESHKKQYKEILKERPGIVCLSTFNLLTSDYTDYFDYEDKINADLLYVGNKSLWLDIKIILKCCSHVLFRRNKMITVKLNKKRIGVQRNSIFDKFSIATIS